MSTTEQDRTDGATAAFSEAVKAASWEVHEHAEHSRYMQDLMAGRLDRAAYARLVAQQYFAYRDLEAASQRMADDPIGSRFVFPELYRLPALHADLDALLGRGWRSSIEPTPATAAYCGRLRDVAATDPGAYVAHHYVRYMGDLSGGQVIRRVVERTYDIADHAGTSFYVFDRVDPKAFKQQYRLRLDATPWTEPEKARIIDEVLLAYRLNTDVLAELA
ncbi:heme oxygenase (biliverdin-producing) [Rhabdothermincola salaria]|uniref:biliverdin-producing heme oxygenase n=1 Tax=Rhabdothermincola salaria TaxID=2903142 RepID=UPI001E3BCB17|nr:biliverdin-producing heme oxygenase [Rhabdothermincola salaria]